MISSLCKLFVQFILENYQNRLIFYNVWNIVRHEMKTYNLFKSGSNQIHIIRRERYSTRLYLFLLSISILIIIIYTISSKEIINQTIERPSQATYEKLMESYASKLQCSCSQISMSYGQVMTMNVIFHQVCSSDFVSDLWLNFLFSNSYWFVYERADIRVRGSAFFNFLSTLCKLATSIIQNAIWQFLSEQFINVNLIPESLFHVQMNVAINEFLRLNPARLAHILELSQGIVHGNTFVSSYLLNWHWSLYNNNRNQTMTRAHAITLNNSCSCGTRRYCVQPGGIYSSTMNNSYWMMPGLNIGCSVVETLLRSTLECLYNQTCIDLLQLYIGKIPTLFPNIINLTAMDPMLPSRFMTNITIHDLANELFIEEVQYQTSYLQFYEKCAPNYCSYIFEKRSNFLIIISQILALWGGLTLSFGFLAPCIVQLLFKINVYRQNNRVNIVA
ncbi:unnamed protein product [Rotaria sp. Silwood1]|nr:unnamed protein product [Rotaria sp. Silwood1]